ncbi:hypothetical protein [Streptomyces geranii]|uniref:hypothetical protein n=1 Tax=Streptomyces geranii TaxID=2058923 RepID=UPI000D035B4B|nr:hypothetical protein [Streptomyces geranii]
MTVQLDGVGRQLEELLVRQAKEGADAGAGDGPVFVDETGRRSRRYRRIGIVVGIACAVYAVVIVGTLLSGNSDAPWLPVPGQQDEQPAGQVETSPLPAESAPVSESAGSSPTPEASVGPSAVPSQGTSATPEPSASAARPSTSTSAKPAPSASRPDPDPSPSVSDPAPSPSVSVSPSPSASGGPDPSPDPSPSTNPGTDPVAGGSQEPVPIASEGPAGGGPSPADPGTAGSTSPEYVI